MAVDLGDPVIRSRSGDGSALESALRARVRGEVRFDSGTRATYSTDASNYREVPIAVVVPYDGDDAVAAIAVCREHDVPVLSRGRGTNLAGSTTNTAVVLDWTKYCHRLVSVDPDRQVAVVEPGRPWTRSTTGSPRTGSRSARNPPPTRAARSAA